MTMLALKHDTSVVLNDTMPFSTPGFTVSLSATPATSPAPKAPPKMAAQKSNSSSDLFAQLEQLFAEREKWETTLYKSSNEQLYGFLARSLDIYQQMRGLGSASLHQRKQLNRALKALNINFTASTNLATKVVRFVFRNDRKRSHAYSRVILEAHEQDVDAMGLPTWISEQGGIEQVRRKSSGGISPADLNKQHKATAEKLLKAGEALIPAFKAVGGLAVSAEGNSAYVVALLRDNGDGTLSAVYGINNESLVGAVLTFAGKKLIESQQSDDANTQMRNVKSKRSSILAKAA